MCTSPVSHTHEATQSVLLIKFEILKKNGYRWVNLNAVPIREVFVWDKTRHVYLLCARMNHCAHESLQNRPVRKTIQNSEWESTRVFVGKRKLVDTDRGIKYIIIFNSMLCVTKLQEVFVKMGHWLRHCATSRKVVVSIQVETLEWP